MQKQYDNSGILFRCDGDKQTPNTRDYRGEITIEGRAFWLSGWIKEGRKGKFLSLAVKPKDEQPEAKREVDDEVPF